MQNTWDFVSDTLIVGSYLQLLCKSDYDWCLALVLDESHYELRYCFGITDPCFTALSGGIEFETRTYMKHKLNQVGDVIEYFRK